MNFPKFPCYCKLEDFPLFHGIQINGRGFPLDLKKSGWGNNLEKISI